jgi:hypothetical protein
MTTIIGNEVAQLNANVSTAQEAENARELFSYRQFSKAMNRSRYLDELRARDK